MNLLNKLIESFLIEAAALTKGSQRVMNDKKLVAGLADSVRDDVQSNPSAFPPGSKNNFKKATDEAIAQWFLENIDQIEREGYEGTVYSRDGVNSDWIVRRYIAGSHSWEDLTGVMNMNLRDWYLLKNRDMLDANHRDLPKFNSVRDLGYYTTTHYREQLEKVRDAAKNAARNKMAKSAKIVDNDDYRIYTALNRAAGCAIGLGTQWCTANSNYGGHFHSYAGRAMLFQLFPYVEKKNEKTGEDELALSDNEKFQFDAGGPNFMNINDQPVSPEKVRQAFPYLYTDLVAGLRANKGKIEKLIKDSSEDPSLQGEDYKVKNYDIDQEIAKLDNLKSRGYFTDEVRPKDLASEPEANTPEISAPETPPQEPRMETIRQLARAMLEDKTLGHIVQQYVPTDRSGQESPLTHGSDNLDETNFDECTGIDSIKQKLAQTLSKRGDNNLGEDDMMQDAGGAPEAGAQAATGGSLGSMGGGGGGGQYPPGTAPTMPESIHNKGNKVMENVDKDVAAMLNSLKKYDKLNESVLGMVTLSMAKPVAEGWDEDQAKKEKLKAPPEEVNIEESGDVEEGNEFSGKLAKAKSEDKKSFKIDGKTVPVKETVDPDILDWMNRFSKLGNMKGYGR